MSGWETRGEMFTPAITSNSILTKIPNFGNIRESLVHLSLLVYSFCHIKWNNVDLFVWMVYTNRFHYPLCYLMKQVGRDRLFRYSGLHPLRPGRQWLGQTGVRWPLAGDGPVLHRHDPAPRTQFQNSPHVGVGAHFQQTQFAQPIPASFSNHRPISRKNDRLIFFPHYNNNKKKQNLVLQQERV